MQNTLEWQNPIDTQSFHFPSNFDVGCVYEIDPRLKKIKIKSWELKDIQTYSNTSSLVWLLRK